MIIIAKIAINKARILYSRFKKAIAPSAIADDISVNFSTSSGEDAPLSIEIALTRRE